MGTYWTGQALLALAAVAFVLFLVLRHRATTRPEPFRAVTVHFTCPHCRAEGRHRTLLTPPTPGRTTRALVLFCRACGKPSTVVIPDD